MNNLNTLKTHELLVAISTVKPTKQTASNMNKKQKVSRRVLIARQSENITVVCDATGVVSMMDIPLIPDHVLIWTSPLASLPNCRGLIQQGFSYLERLDTQVLAGILITVADSYSLLKYAPSDTGAQKNAILRTAGKLTLINCLLLIEEYINSHNRCFLPSLSLLFDTQVEQNGIEVKLTEWMKLIASILLRSQYPTLSDDSSVEDEFYSEAPKKQITPEYIRDRRAAKNKAAKAAKSADWALTNKKWAEQREYKADIKTAKDLIKTLANEVSLSPKLSSLLKSVFTEDSLITMDSSMRALLSAKMAMFEPATDTSKALVTILEKPYSLLRSEYSSLSLDDLGEPPIKEEANSVGEAKASTESLPVLSEPSITSAIEQTVTIAPAPAKKTFTEILLAKKRLATESKE